MADQVIHWDDYAQETDKIPYLKAHRDWVEEHSWGFGDRPLHYMWYTLLKDLPQEAKLLEIGVFKGQVVSLWGLIGKKLGKYFDIYGVTPLNKQMIDKYHAHEIVTQDHITTICNEFGVGATIYDYDSTDPNCPVETNLDVLFIDGGHNYDTVVSDIDKFTPGVNVGGFVVFDDASCSLPDFGHWYKGLDDVSRAIDEFALRDDYKETLTVGHNRCFTKLA